MSTMNTTRIAEKLAYKSKEAGFYAAKQEVSRFLKSLREVSAENYKEIIIEYEKFLDMDISDYNRRENSI